jgi:hypothetical protein
MWRAVGVVLAQWAQDWHEMLDPLDVKTSMAELRTVWDRLGGCLTQVSALLVTLVKDSSGEGAGPHAREADNSIVVEVNQLKDTLSVQRSVMEDRAMFRACLATASMTMSDPVPRRVFSDMSVSSLRQLVLAVAWPTLTVNATPGDAGNGCLQDGRPA